MTRSICLSEAPPVSPSQSRDSEKDWMTRVATFAWSISDLQRGFALAGYSGKTSPVSSHPEEEGILVPSSGRWLNSGMGGPTGSLTLSTLEFPSAAVASSLSDILETGVVPQRFFLSATACQGILRRAEKRGKNLPETLRLALEAEVTVECQAAEENIWSLEA